MRRFKYSIWDLFEELTNDKEKWNYSSTTSKYRNLFLGEDTKETKEKIKNKIYKLKNLNVA